MASLRSAVYEAISRLAASRDGKEIERVTTNAVGNFHTATPLPEGFAWASSAKYAS
ncbi:MAG: hypothetical protein ACKV2T_31290 [Kofleriaceae bacterium]